MWGFNGFRLHWNVHFCSGQKNRPLFVLHNNSNPTSRWWKACRLSWINGSLRQMQAAESSEGPPCHSCGGEGPASVFTGGGGTEGGCCSNPPRSVQRWCFHHSHSQVTGRGALLTVRHSAHITSAVASIEPGRQEYVVIKVISHIVKKKKDCSDNCSTSAVKLQNILIHMAAFAENVLFRVLQFKTLQPIKFILLRVVACNDTNNTCNYSCDNSNIRARDLIVHASQERKMLSPQE